MRILLALTLLLGATTVGAEQPPACAGYEAARGVIRDLDRIVSPRGIQETYKARIGGIDQWIYVRGQDRANPVLLFVHGGPASPMSAAMWAFQRPLEEYFTVVHWDQRGAGKTFLEADPDRVRDTLRIDRYVQDAIEVTEHVAALLGAPKVVLVGHSWGTIVGLRAVMARPDLYAAYVGIGQVISARENERLSYAYAFEQAKQFEDADALRELASIAPYPGDAPITRERIVVARKWAQHYGGLSAYRARSTYYFEAPLLSPEYDARDVAAIDQGSQLTLARILPEFLQVDFRGVRRLAVPVFMLLGRHDYTTPSAPTEAWLKQLEAPAKRAVWFENSAHLIPFEEPGKLLLTLVQEVRPLAVKAAEGGAARAGR